MIFPESLLLVFVHSFRVLTFALYFLDNCYLQQEKWKAIRNFSKQKNLTFLKSVSVKKHDENLKVQSSKLYNDKFMTASTQKTNTEIFAEKTIETVKK